MPNNETSSRSTRATGAALVGLLLVPATTIDDDDVHHGC